MRRLAASFRPPSDRARSFIKSTEYASRDEAISAAAERLGRTPLAVLHAVEEDARANANANANADSD